MSEYNHFAQQLDTAFKTARNEFAAAHSANEKALAAEMNARINGSDTQAKIAALEAKEAAARFDAERGRIWAAFDQQVASLSAGLEKELAGPGVSPDAVDNNAVFLMESGVMTASDYVAFAEKFDGNSTMTRLVGRYAKQAAEDAENVGDRQTASTLRVLANECGTGEGRTMRAWRDLVSVANRCSGRGPNATGRDAGGKHCLGMMDRWEQLCGEIVKAF